MINFQEPHHFVGFWYVYPPSDEFVAAHPNVAKNDWIACVWVEQSGKLVCYYRWLYYGPDREQDKRSWHGIEAKPGTKVQEMVETIHTIASLCALRNQSEMVYVPIDGDGAKAGEILQEMEWFHILEGKR